MSRLYIVVSWTDHRRKQHGAKPTTREYGTAASLQAAIRLAERVLPPDVEYAITTLTRTVHEARSPPQQLHRGLSR